MTVRRLLLKVHLIIGFAAAPLLAVLGASGAVLVFEDEIDHWLNRDLLTTRGTGPVLSPAALQDRVEQGMPGTTVRGLSLSDDDGHAWVVNVVSKTGEGKNLLVDPHDGRILGEVAGLRTTTRTIHQFHTRLLAGTWGRAVVGWGGVTLVILAVSGLVLWWPGKILTVRGSGSMKRLVFEVHSAVGGVAWLALLGLGITAIGIHWNQPAMSALAGVLGERLPGPFPEHAPGCDGAPDLPLSRLITAAESRVPGARTTGAFLGDGDEPARVIMRFPEDRTPAGRTNVFLAPCSGRILEARSTRDAPVSYRALAMWNREIHTGDLLGWPTRILAALVSLSLPVLALSGPLIWWTRRRRTAG